MINKEAEGAFIQDQAQYRLEKLACTQKNAEISRYIGYFHYSCAGGTLAHRAPNIAHGTHQRIRFACLGPGPRPGEKITETRGECETIVVRGHSSWNILL